jgi:hypothetical protein
MFHGAGALVLVEIGGSVPRVDRIDFDWQTFGGEFAGKKQGLHVERGFGAVVSHDPIRRAWRGFWVAISRSRERTQATGDVDNAAGGRLLQQTEHGFGHGQWTNKVYLEGGFELFKIQSSFSPKLGRSLNSEMEQKRISSTHIMRAAFFFRGEGPGFANELSVQFHCENFTVSRQFHLAPQAANAQNKGTGGRSAPR